MRSEGRVLGWGIAVVACAMSLACGGGGGGGPPVVNYDLTVTKTGTGTGTVSSSPSGIDCGSTCAKSYASGTLVTLTATPLASGSFGGWAGECVGTGPCVVTLSAASEVTATFISYHHRPAETALRVSYHAGNDGTYGTADDVAYGYNRVTFNSDGDSSKDVWYYGANPSGPDGHLFTADDVPGGYWTQPGSTYGWNTRTPGLDGAWFTSDDPITDWEKFGTTVAGQATNVLHDGAGPDGQWFTADDVIEGYYLRSLDASGGETRRLSYVGAGTDGIWFTADDVLSADGYWTAQYSQGNWRWASWDRQVIYTGAGSDGVWATADDVVGSCKVHQFADDSQYWTTETTSAPGPDGICFTADDLVIGYARATNTY